MNTSGNLTNHKRRLSHLVDILKEVRAGIRKETTFAGDTGFSLDTWNSVNPDHPCGTTACAVGWAMYDSAFNDEGLTPYENGFNKMIQPEFTNESGFTYRGWNAVHFFFEINHEDAIQLFTNRDEENEQRSIDVVIASLEHYIETGKVVLPVV